MIISYGNCVKQKITLNFGASVDLLLFILQISDLTKINCWFSVRRLCLLARGLQNKHPNYQEL